MRHYGRNLFSHWCCRIFRALHSGKIKRAWQDGSGAADAGDKAHLSEGIIYEMGDITKLYTLKEFFSHAEGKQMVVIHCTRLVSIASNKEQLWKVNVDGTRNIVDLCKKYGTRELVYVSSVHAIPEAGEGMVIKEPERCLASLVVGDYGKSKTEAAFYVKKAAESGLDAVTASYHTLFCLYAWQ